MDSAETQPGLTVDPRFPPSRGGVDYRRGALRMDEAPFVTAASYDTYPWLADAMHSFMTARLMRLQAIADDRREGDRQTAEKETMRLFNGCFVTVNENDSRHPDGSLNILSPLDIARLFPRGLEARWPAGVLFSSNHAMTTDHRDIATIGHGMRKVIEDAGGRPLAIEARPSPAQDLSGKVILPMAIWTESQALHNGASLLGRLQERKRNAPETRQPFPQGILNGVFPMRQERREAVPPAGVMLGKMLLAACVTEPARIHFHSPFTEAELETGQVRDRAHLPPDLCPAPVPLILRRDAWQILSRFLGVGYSKAGNSVTEALLWLREELRATDSERQIDAETPAFLRIEQSPGGSRPLQHRDIRSLLSSVGLLSINAGEQPLRQVHLDDGIRRLSIGNDQDSVSQHFDHGETYLSGDTKLIVRGTPTHGGHSPLEALIGARGLDIGYVAADPRAAEHIRALGARLYGIEPGRRVSDAVAASPGLPSPLREPPAGLGR